MALPGPTEPGLIGAQRNHHSEHLGWRLYQDSFCNDLESYDDDTYSSQTQRHVAPACSCAGGGSRDGYRVSFSLAEPDPGFRERPILLPHQRDGQTMAENQGPLRLVVADEARPARWVRQLSGLRVIDPAGSP